MRASSPDAAKAGVAFLKGLARGALELRPPPEKGKPSRSEQVLPLSVVRDTRQYLLTTAHQINGSYENGWYDACAVMMRKLLETLIIEVFEHRGSAAVIKTPRGDFESLEALIGKVIGNPGWNLGRTTKRALQEVKELGDNAAHGRRFSAHRGDIDRLRVGFRAAVQELVQLCGWT